MQRPAACIGNAANDCGAVVWHWAPARCIFALHWPIYYPSSTAPHRARFRSLVHLPRVPIPLSFLLLRRLLSAPSYQRVGGWIAVRSRILLIRGVRISCLLATCYLRSTVADVPKQPSPIDVCKSRDWRFPSANCGRGVCLLADPGGISIRQAAPPDPASAASSQDRNQSTRASSRPPFSILLCIARKWSCQNVVIREPGDRRTGDCKLCLAILLGPWPLSLRQHRDCQSSIVKHVLIRLARLH